MKRAYLLLLALLAACDEGGAPTMEQRRVRLRCGNYDVTVEIIDRDTLKTAINGEKIEMHSAVSASGAKYEGKGAVVSASVWNKGENWLFSLENSNFINCRVLK